MLILDITVAHLATNVHDKIVNLCRIRPAVDELYGFTYSVVLKCGSLTSWPGCSAVLGRVLTRKRKVIRVFLPTVYVMGGYLLYPSCLIHAKG